MTYDGSLRVETEDLESAACLRLGKFLFEYAQLEINLALCVKYAKEGMLEYGVRQANSKRSFASSLEALQLAVEVNFNHDSTAYASWTAWYMRADAIRELRNRFVHSRWVAWWHKNLIVSVTGVPGDIDRTEEFYTLADMDKVIKESQVLHTNFWRFRKRYPIE